MTPEEFAAYEQQKDAAQAAYDDKIKEIEDELKKDAKYAKL